MHRKQADNAMTVLAGGSELAVAILAFTDSIEVCPLIAALHGQSLMPGRRRKRKGGQPWLMTRKQRIRNSWIV